MSPNNLTLHNARSIVAALLPLCLWLMLFLSIQSGDIRNITHPGFNYTFLQGLRAALPLIAAFVAVVLLVIKITRQRPEKFLFLGPLGLAAVYGLVGVIASTLSPKGWDSLYWSVIYLSVPLVLWAIVGIPSKSYSWISRLIALNWLIIVLATASLFAFGLLYLTLGDFLLRPSTWLDCSPQAWFNKTSHYLRGTGVGRYAALTGIIALSRLWHPRGRSLWGLVFLASMILLLYSGARTSMIGFAVAVPVVVLLSGGKRAALGFLIMGVALTPVFWTTGIHSDYLDNCIFRGTFSTGLNSSSQGSQSLNSSSQDAPAPTVLVPASSQSLNSSSQDAPAPTEPSPANSEKVTTDVVDIPLIGVISKKFFSFSGRTKVWRQGLDLFSESPLLGYGFHADRFLLGTHAHNSLVHSLLQTGVVGTIPFVAGLLLAWALLMRTGLNLVRFSQDHKTLFIQVAGVLAFLSIRSITESTGAFFGVDWLLLGPILLYLQVVNSSLASTEVTSQRHASFIG